MKRKQKKEMLRRLSTRQLMGITGLTEHGVKTPNGELVFYLIAPNNLSVLSEEGVRQRVMALSNLIRASSELMVMALDSRESFQHNKDYYRRRLEQEPCPAIRELLRQDMEHLDAIQSGTASSREFAVICKMEDPDAAQLATLEKRISTNGFLVRLANEQDVKRILAVYYQQDAVTDQFDSFDGESVVKDRV